MTFAVRSVHTLGAGPVNPIPNMSLLAYNGSGGGATATLNVLATGGISYSNGSGASKWYDPLTTAIGSNYWVKFTLASGTAWNAGLTAGTLYQVTSTRSLTWSVGAVGAKTATVTVQIYSNAGGTVLVGSGTLSVDVSSESGA